jgi:elongation factor Tu
MQHLPSILYQFVIAFSNFFQAIEDKDPKLGKEAILALLEAVDNHIPTPDRTLEEPFLLPVEHVHSIPGRGTVLTGRATRGKCKIGNEVEVIGYNMLAKCKITGIEMFHKSLEEGLAGDQMGVLMRGLKKDDVRRGMVITKPGVVKQHDRFTAQVSVLCIVMLVDCRKRERNTRKQL